MRTQARLTIPALLITLAAGSPASSAEGLGTEQQLGQSLYMDINLSLLRNQSCNRCHAVEPVTPIDRRRPLPAAGFVDPDNVRTGSAVSQGSVDGRQGTLNAPSVGYARFSPHFHWDGADGLYVGGQFWNGRAATLADQAKGPPLNPREMAMPSEWAVVSRLKENPAYVEAFRRLYRIDLDAIPAREGAAPDLLPPPGVQEAFAGMAQAIGAFESSRVFSPFTSKYDFVMAGVTEFTDRERAGLELFNSDRSQCSECHSSAPLKSPDGGHLPPLFTDFSYDNLGLPRNLNIAGQPPPDPGLGGRPEIMARDPHGEQIGKHKVMGLRNIALTAPYMHNGVLPSLRDVVHFYNTRDSKPRRCRDNTDPGFGRDCWPAPEVSRNVNTEELGDLGLSAAQEAALVAFMETLTDGYPEWGQDAKVPPGSPSPFAETALPPAP